MLALKPQQIYIYIYIIIYIYVYIYVYIYIRIYIYACITVFVSILLYGIHHFFPADSASQLPHRGLN